MNEYNLLSNIKESSDIKKLSKGELIKLASEIRTKIIKTVSQNGGHLASNLGAVELTIALHLAFNFPKDQVVFDVSHQSYPHKLLTGRFEWFDTLRTFKGMSGYCKITESEYDVFGAGHASTSISAALGLKVANCLKGINNNVIAVIGDGALTGGMAFEALNSLGNMQTNLITIINDNEQSISENVGALSSVLNNLRTSKKYIKIKDDVKDKLPKIPLVGASLTNFVSKTKNMIKQGLVEGMFFEDLGLTYIGIIDGHNIEQMLHIFNAVKEFNSPVIIHLLSQKGRGYLPAIENPEIYHGVGTFDLSKGLEKTKTDIKSLSFSEVFGRKILDLGTQDKSIVAITAAMDIGTKLEYFKSEFKDRFFDVGIAEAHAMTFAAGLAKNGLKPYFAVYSTFLQRAYDQLIHDVCIQNLPVRICIDRCGLVGEDGPTHHGVFDMQMLLAVPNLEVLSPYSKEDLEYCLDYSLNVNHPIAIRYPRKKAPLSNVEPSLDVVCDSNNGELAIVAFGSLYDLAIEVSDLLNSQGVENRLIKLNRLKPLKAEDILKHLAGVKTIVTIEDSQKIGGFGTYLQGIIQEKSNEYEFINFGYPDQFVEHGSISELNKSLGLDSDSVISKILLLIS